MALQTKAFQSNTTSNQFYLKLTLTENSTNQTNNTSSVSYTLKLYSGGWDFSQYKIGHSISLAGKTVSSVERANANQYSISTNSSITIASGTTTISHNSDGSKNMSVSFSIDMAKDSWTPGAISVSGKSMTLTSIPRASTVSCSTANIGSNATITINRASSSFTHTLSYTFGSLDGTIVTKTNKTSVSWAIPTSFYARIPNSKSGTGTITCDTYNGSTKIGTKTCTFTAKVSESASKPMLSPTVVDNNSTTIALTGDNTKFIKYCSNAAVTTGAEARNSATLKSQKITCGSKSISSESGTINKVESGSFTFSATDSRGYTTSQTVTKTLINYVKLTCSMNASAASTSGVAELKISGNYWDGNFGVTNNTLTVQYRYKEQDGTYSNWTNSSASVDKSNNTYSTTVTISGLNYLNAYIFQSRAIDKLATVESTEQTRKTVPVFDWGKNDFKVNGDFRVTGKTTLDGNLTGKYITGTWLQTTAATDLNSTPPKVAVLDNSGWIYSRTPNELKSDMGLSNIFISQTISPKDWNIKANSSRGGEIKGTFKGYEGYTPILTSCYCVNSYYIAIINAWLSGSYSSSSNGYTWHIDARNFASSNITADFAIYILWIKSNLFG